VGVWNREATVTKTRRDCRLAFPAQHPNFRNAQVVPKPGLPEGDSPDEAELAAGSVLYVPPFWFVQVLNADSVVSIQSVVSSESEISAASQAAIQFPQLPFQSPATWGYTKVIVTVRAFLHSVHKAAFALADLKASSLASLTATMARRYKMLAKPLRKFSKASRLAGTKLCSEEVSWNDVVAELRSDSKLCAAFEDGAQRLSRVFTSVGDTHVREMLFVEYAEELADFATGDRFAHLFVRQCLAEHSVHLDFLSSEA
jgi:hypothetical protein